MRLPELESIYQTAPVGLAVLDLELRFVRVNQRLAEMNGASIAAHLGRSVHEVVPDVAAQAEPVLRQVLATGEPVRDVEVHGETCARPGDVRVWREQFYPLRDEHDAIVGISVVAEEITERREAEMRLRQSQQQLALALEAGGLTPWDWDIATGRWRLGADWDDTLTYRPAQAVPNFDTWLSLVHPDDRVQARHAIEAHLQGRSEAYECEYRVHRADGSWRWIASRGRVVERDAGGRPRRMLGLRRDVTAEKRTRDDLREQARLLQHSQLRLQVALDAAAMGVWDWSHAGAATYWSPGVFRLLGLPDKAQCGADFDLLLQRVHSDDRAALDAEIARALDKGGDYQAEFRVLAADGSVRWLASRGRVIREAGSDASRVVGVLFDITERRQIEQALREADARRTEFLAMLAHELRNPLAPIVNAVRLLERAGDVPERREAATQILRRQSTHMARLVDDLLEVSRITQGLIELRMENVLVATSIFQAVEAVRAQARERHQVLGVDVPPTLDLVADPARLTQIVANLVTNAVKYTQDGGTIDISARAHGEDWLEIVVRDNGNGISPELLPRLFDLFTQDQRTLDRSEGGMGIGLALVSRLTELHGGSVQCDSAGPGQGATFTVRLPRRGRREEQRGTPVSRAPARLAPMPMLVVDDNADAAQTLASLLALDGHRVQVATDGQAALALATALQPRVVVLDLGLPKMNGLAVARALRADLRTRDVVLIAASGYAQASDRSATAEAGFDAHLAKPLELADLYRAIEEQLGR